MVVSRLYVSFKKSLPLLRSIGNVVIICNVLEVGTDTEFKLNQNLSLDFKIIINVLIRKQCFREIVSCGLVSII